MTSEEGRGGALASAFERASIPVAVGGGGFVGILQELEYVAEGVLGSSRGLVWEHELFEVLVIVGALGADLVVLEARGLRVRVGVEDGLGERRAAGPEARA